MGLRMVAPWRHPDSGIFWYRRKVPGDLRPLVGKTEVRRSLGTRDPAAARVEFTRVAAEIELQWASLRRGVQPVSHRQAIAIAGEIYREIVATYADNPQDRTGWRGGLVTDQALFTPKKVRMSFAGDEALMRGILERVRSSYYMDRVEAFLSARGMIVSEDAKQAIHTAVGQAIVQAREHLDRMAGGDYRPDPDAARFPELAPTEPAVTQTSTVTESADRYSLLAVFEAYAKEQGLAPTTLKAWRRIIRNIAREHPDIRTIDKTWCLGWKDALLNRGLSAGTVNNGYLAALRATCTWAKKNDRIKESPLTEVAVTQKKKAPIRSLGFTDDEANRILSAALLAPDGRITPKYASARRWLPWLCAYTGARVGEIGQLRKQDVIETRGIPLIFITPDAGTTKNERSRYVAIHPHLIEQGFLDFVRGQGSGPLFYDPSRMRGGSVENPQYKKVGERIASWVRSIGITDPVLQPNHAWRHRFKTLARRHDLDPGTVTYMQGHAFKTEGDLYGDHEPEVLLREIAKLPAYSATDGT